MAKITIDDVEYQTDDFTESQNSIYQEMLVARSEMQRLEYTYRVLEARTKMLAELLATAPEEEEEGSDGKES